MNDTVPSQSDTEGMPREAMQSALFAQLVLQQTNLALMLLGKTPHPETGQITRDLEAARLFIDQLEMLEAKTKGNLNREEARMLQQSLMTLRMTFVEEVEKPGASAGAAPEAQAKPATPEEKTAPSGATEAAAPEEQSPKRFSKKY